MNHKLMPFRIGCHNVRSRVAREDHEPVPREVPKLSGYTATVALEVLKTLIDVNQKLTCRLKLMASEQIPSEVTEC